MDSDSTNESSQRKDYRLSESVKFHEYIPKDVKQKVELKSKFKNVSKTSHSIYLVKNNEIQIVIHDFHITHNNDLFISPFTKQLKILNTFINLKKWYPKFKNMLNLVKYVKKKSNTKSNITDLRRVIERKSLLKSFVGYTNTSNLNRDLKEKYKNNKL